MSSFFTRVRVRASGDAGFLLVEIMVSAVLLVTVSLATLQLISQSDKLAGDDQGRATAANVAQSQLEFLRALSPEEVLAQPAVKQVTQHGKEYTLQTSSRWVSDGQSAVDCSKRSGGVDYLQVSVSSDWPGKRPSSPPVKFSTAVTPVASSKAKSGSLVVALNGAAVDGQPSQPTAGVPVEAVGAQQTYNGTTNAKGCVVFPFIPTGSYTVKVSKTGYVDSYNVGALSQAVTVTGGQTTKLQLDYDAGGYTGSPVDPPQYPLVFVTKRAGSNAYQRTAVSAMSIQRAGVASRLERATESPTWDLSGTPLWPSDTPYQLYAGKCAENGKMPPNDMTTVSIGRNVTRRVPNVTVPSIDVEVFDGSNRWWWSNPGRHVQADVTFLPACGTDPIRRQTDRNTGRLDDPGFPYTASGGVLCVSAGNRQYLDTNFANTDFSPNQTRKIYLGDEGSGRC